MGPLLPTSSQPKAAAAISAGADATIDYRAEDVVARVMDLTDGAGVDRIVDVDLGDVGPGNDGANLERAIVVRNDLAGRGHGLETLRSGILGRVVVREDVDISIKWFS